MSRSPCAPPAVEKWVEPVRCDRGEEPRDVLDRLILAWQTDDRMGVERSLGRTGAKALEELMQGRTWARLRWDLWPGTQWSPAAMGYRFEIDGRWSEPEETLEEQREPGNSEGSYNEPAIETVFVDDAGRDCGRMRVRFVRAPEDAARWSNPYAINSADLGELLRVISGCANRRTAMN